jgi:two-component system OmpR family response regulator
MRILLVEDEERLARSVARGLGADGFDVDVVHDGLDGLWRAREGSYAAIVLDIMLPGMNGYEICRTLRSDDIWTPVLFLTAKDGEYDETDGFAIGADDVLAESVRMGQIVEDLLLLSRTDETDGGQYRTVDFDDMVRGGGTSAFDQGRSLRSHPGPGDR